MQKADRELTAQVRQVDKSMLPNFEVCATSLDKALWALWAAGNTVYGGKLTAQQIALILVELQEVSIEPRSILSCLNRGFGKIHRYYEDNQTYYRIMKEGKDYLKSIGKENESVSEEGLTEVIYIKPNTRFTSKKVLQNDILIGLKGEIKIVDPYCGSRTLDILENITIQNIKFLTRIDNLRTEKPRFLREYRDFKSQHNNIEIRDYSKSDIHDRYLISDNEVILIGHSIKDIGSKETFIIVLDIKLNDGLHKILSTDFDTKWRGSQGI